MYADYTFYTDSWHGDVLTEENYAKYGERASDFLDWLTRYRMVDNLPSNVLALDRVKKACCAAADAIFSIDSIRDTQAAAGRSAGLEQSGIVHSLSSGGESISFQVTDLENAVAAGQDEINRYLLKVVKPYLSLIADDAGNYYLYWGL